MTEGRVFRPKPGPYDWYERCPELRPATTDREAGEEDRTVNQTARRASEEQ